MFKDVWVYVRVWPALPAIDKAKFSLIGLEMFNLNTTRRAGSSIEGLSIKTHRIEYKLNSLKFFQI